MRKHLFTSNVNDLIAEGQKILNKDEDSVTSYRTSMVLLVLQGMPALQLSEYTDVEARTIQKWVDDVDKYGFETLRPSKRSGRLPKLSEAQKEEIRQALLEDASLHGYTVWDGITLSDYIADKYSIKMSVRSCQDLFHKLGFSLKRPHTYPYHGKDETARDDFKKNSKT